MTVPRPGRTLAAIGTLLAVIAPAAAGPGRNPAGEQVALVVGVRKYRPNELRELPYAEADADGLAKTLRDVGSPPENVVVMTQSAAAGDLRFAPEAAKIRGELKLLLQNRGPED